MSGVAHLRFPAAVRLRKRAEFDQVYQRGERHSSANMTVIFLAGSGRNARVGFTAGKALGGAVERNRIRRRLREAVRRHLGELRATADVVFHPRRSALRAEFSQLEAEVTRAFAVITKKFSR